MPPDRIYDRRDLVFWKICGRQQAPGFLGAAQCMLLLSFTNIMKPCCGLNDLTVCAGAPGQPDRQAHNLLHMLPTVAKRWDLPLIHFPLSSCFLFRLFLSQTLARFPPVRLRH
jgi:hypothetical protein